MKTFETEYQALLRWLQTEHERLDNQDMTWSGGYDGDKALLERQLGDEYRKRLRALKEKYHC